ncbi:MAG TPA: YicC/YloC family endoribonuclease [Bacteroidota bacterium]|nr:YicC/YloC family endoribonuclease [Bacteroidota bacterium]
MTGYGRGESSRRGMSFTVELRSVNNRFLEITSRLPRSLSFRENEIKEIIRSKINRGKITINVTEQKESTGTELSINKAAAKSYYALLNQLRKTVKIRETVKLEHLIQFSEIFEPGTDGEEESAIEWSVFEEALRQAVDSLKSMRAKEGEELSKDLIARVEHIDQRLEAVERLSRERIPEERTRLTERIAALLDDPKVLNAQRLELEIIMLADKWDVTEECVRFHSHNKFFLEALRLTDAAGRKLNFLIQEMNREANTIGSKCSDIEIAHHVVEIKEELEKIREQLQNIE